MSAHQIPRTPLLAASVLALGLAVAATPLAAQQQLRQPRPSVEVDWSVLDEMPVPGAEAPQLRLPRSVTGQGATGPAANAAGLTPPRTAPTPLAAAPTSPVTRAPLVPPSGGGFVPPAAPPTFGDAAPSTAVPVPATPANPLGAPPSPPPTTAAAPQPLAAPSAAPRPAAPTLNSSTPAPTAMASAPPPPPSANVMRAPQTIVPPAPTAPAPSAPAPAAIAPPPAPIAAAAPPPAPVPVAPAPVAAPAPAPAAAAAPAAPAQVAAAPAARAATDPIARLGFAAGGADLAADARPALARVIEELQRDTAARLQLQAFASGGDDQGGQARRLSLSRALSVRGYLIEQGIASTRIDVRALGRASDGPPDRVDVLLIRR